jgi:hypothetical protein
MTLGHVAQMEVGVPPHVDHVLSKPPKLAELTDTLALCVENAAVEKEGAPKGRNADA